MTDRPLSDKQIDAIYAEHIRPLLFDQIEPSTTPAVFFVGAQPGAGKSRAINRMAGELEARGEDVVVISGDDFREFHPDYERLVREDPIAMPNVTAQLTGPCVKLAISEASARRVHVMLEGTYRDPATTFASMREFAAVGYRTRLATVAVPIEISELNTASRYLRSVEAGTPARWTPHSALTNGYEASARILAQARERAECHQIEVYDGDGRRLAFAERDAEGRWTGHGDLESVCRHERRHSRPSADQYERRLVDLSDRARTLGQVGGEFDLTFRAFDARLQRLRD